jgi:hypothetical protein
MNDESQGVSEDFAAAREAVAALAQEQQQAELREVRVVLSQLPLDDLEAALTDLRVAVEQHRGWLEEYDRWIRDRALDDRDAEGRPIIAPLKLEWCRQTVTDAKNLCNNVSPIARRLAELRGLRPEQLRNWLPEQFVDEQRRLIAGWTPSASRIRESRIKLEGWRQEIVEALARRRGVQARPTSGPLPSPDAPKRPTRAKTNLSPRER